MFIIPLNHAFLNLFQSIFVFLFFNLNLRFQFLPLTFYPTADNTCACNQTKESKTKYGSQSNLPLSLCIHRMVEADFACTYIKHCVVIEK